jgi:hypothetical protein
VLPCGVDFNLLYCFENPYGVIEAVAKVKRPKWGLTQVITTWNGGKNEAVGHLTPGRSDQPGITVEKRLSCGAKSRANQAKIRFPGA